MSIIKASGSWIEAPAPVVSTGRRFQIHDPGRFWIIDSGKVDLYIAEARNGEPTGAYHHLMRLSEGQAFFGIRPEDEPGIVLIASPSPGASVRSDSIDGLRRASITDPAEGDLIRLLEDWIHNLSEASARGTIPKDFVTLGPGQLLKIADGARFVLPGRKLVWLEQVTGTSRILATEGMTIHDGSPLYPVSRFGWVEAQSGSEIRGHDTDVFLRHPSALESLKTFHSYFVINILRNWREAEAKRQRRLQAKAEADARTLETAVHELSRPVEGRPVEVPNIEGIMETPLMKACRIIGESMGVAMKTHPDLWRGIDQKDSVASIAKASGVRCRRVVLRGQWWKQGGGPLLVFRESDRHPMALIPSSACRYRLNDPNRDRIVSLTPKIAASLNPVAYSFYRSLPGHALSARDLLAFGLKGTWSDLFKIILMGIATGVFAVVPPFATGIIFDSLIPGAKRKELWITCGFMIVAAVAGNLFNLTRNFTVLRLQGRLGTSLQAAVWDRLLSLPVSFFRDYTAGDLAVRSMGISEIRQILTGVTLDAMLSGIFSVFSFALLFNYSSQLALVATALSLIALVVTALSGYLELGLTRRALAQSSSISGMVLQFITGIAKFRVAGAEKRAFAMWVREFTKQKSIDYTTRRVSAWLATFNSVYLIVCLVVIFWYNATFLRSGTEALSTGEFLAFIAAFSQFMCAALAFGSAIVSVTLIVPVYELAAPILRTPPEVNVVKSNPGELTGAVEADHLVFRYRPDSPLVLNDLSFSAAPGQYIAFVGPSGCGKSTLLRLLLGFETAESGAVYFDGQDLAGIDPQAVRQQIGVVLQTSTLVSGSILDNIRGADSLTVEDVWEAARLSGLEADIRGMPMGMYTMIHEGGGGLSGGQRQRIMIARAIARKPKILIMDEATSALDNCTQAIVSESLKSLKSTRIVIAHRLSTIIDADLIFVMNKGKIVQSGTYRELMRERGLFGELASRQIA